MIFREELRKAKTENERLKKEYEQKMLSFAEEIDVLKEKMSAQEQMIKSAFDYAIRLEEQLKLFRRRMAEDKEKNNFGYH